MLPEPARADVPMTPALVLLRHGEVDSHQGDVPLTRTGRGQAERAGRRLAQLAARRVWIFAGPTLRAQQTGLLVLHGLTGANPASKATGPTVTPALRNPDLYLAGHRVDMVSTAAAFAAQLSGTTEEQVTRINFYANFLTSADRIGYWLHHDNPPGDTVAAVATRVHRFAASLGDAGRVDLVIGITQSPVLRALAAHYLGKDPGEPDYLDGYCVGMQSEDSLALHTVDWTRMDPRGPTAPVEQHQSKSPRSD
jgi:broad specificity phosphatase PhoE